MKILVANPNTSTGVTDRLVAAGKLVASPGTELLPMTARTACPTSPRAPRPRSAPSRRWRCWRNGAATIDAAIVAAFGDPGLGGARELFDFPVVGMAEAAMLMACTLGRRFAIVSFAKALEPWFAEIVAWHGLTRPLRRHPHARRGLSLDRRRAGREGSRCWSIWPTAPSPNDAADVVILAGAPLAGLANKMRERVPVPLVDGIQAAVDDGRRAGAPEAAQGHCRHLSPAGREGLQGSVHRACQRDRSPDRDCVT